MFTTTIRRSSASAVFLMVPCNKPFTILKHCVLFVCYPVLVVVWCLCPPRETSTTISSTHNLRSPCQTWTRSRPRSVTLDSSLVSYLQMYIHPWSASYNVSLFIPCSVSLWSLTPAPCWLMAWPSAWHPLTSSSTWVQRRSAGEDDCASAEMSICYPAADISNY